MITMNGIRSIKNAVVGIKQSLHNQKISLFKLIWNKIGALMSLRGPSLERKAKWVERNAWKTRFS